MNVLIAGAGGFIGGHLAADMSFSGGHKVRCVDIKPLDEWYQVHEDCENWQLDLKGADNCLRAMEDIDLVYNLAADMGGMGFIENNKALCMLSVLINTHLLMAANQQMVNRYFFASSACAYNIQLQQSAHVTALKEEDAYPAMPEDGYGWEKLFSERMCRHYMEDFKLLTRVARFHNVYGPHGTYKGGREKAPAAICRKIIEAEISGKHEIEIWGDGEQTRSFMWIGDCIKGIRLIMNGSYPHPINLGSSELVSINQLVTIVEEIADIKCKRIYKPNAPKGVNGRNSDNTLIKKVYDWEPSTKLKQGMKETYLWILDQMIK